MDFRLNSKNYADSALYSPTDIYTITEKYQPNPRETRCTAIDNGLVEWIKNFNKSFC